MQLTWHLLVIIAAVLFGVCMFQKGEQTPNMSDSQLKEAEEYRMWAYVLWAVAAGVTGWWYMNVNRQKATMCGAGHAHHYGNMHHGKATMCGVKY